MLEDLSIAVDSVRWHGLIIFDFRWIILLCLCLIEKVSLKDALQTKPLVDLGHGQNLPSSKNAAIFLFRLEIRGSSSSWTTYAWFQFLGQWLWDNLCEGHGFLEKPTVIILLKTAPTAFRDFTLALRLRFIINFSNLLSVSFLLSSIRSFLLVIIILSWIWNQFFYTEVMKSLLLSLLNWFVSTERLFVPVADGRLAACMISSLGPLQYLR